MLHQTKETFKVPEDFSLEGFIGPSFEVFQGEPVMVKVWFSPDVAGTDEIKFWIMGCGSHSLVLEPESLREEIRTETERMANRYEGRILAEETQSYGLTHDHPLQCG